MCLALRTSSADVPDCFQTPSIIRGPHENSPEAGYCHEKCHQRPHTHKRFFSTSACTLLAFFKLGDTHKQNRQMHFAFPCSASVLYMHLTIHTGPGPAQKHQLSDAGPGLVFFFLTCSPSCIWRGAYSVCTYFISSKEGFYTASENGSQVRYTKQVSRMSRPRQPTTQAK
jgi:hypothetical protein